MDLYTEDVLDHHEHPRNQGELAGEGVVTAREMNSSCGDMVEFFLKIKDGVIEDVKWKGVGCAVTTAAASKLSEYLQGQTLKEVRAMSEEELVKAGVGFEVNAGRLKCLTLPITTVKKLFRS